MDGLAFDLERDQLSTRLGGTLPRGALGIIEGPSGSGKSVLSQRLAYGLIKNGHNVVYVSTEFTTNSFLNQMEQLNYPVMDEVIRRQLLFVTTHPQIGHPAPKWELLPRLLSSRNLLSQPVVIVDTFSQLAESHLSDPNRAQGILQYLITVLKKINASDTTLLLTLDPDHLASIDLSPLVGAAEIRIECSVERMGDKVDRFLVTRKFARAQGIVGDVVPFRVEPGAGFIVEIKEVA